MNPFFFLNRIEILELCFLLPYLETPFYLGMTFDAFSTVYWISSDSALHSLEFVCRMGFVFSRLSISPFKGFFMVDMFLMVINDDLMSSFA